MATSLVELSPNLKVLRPQKIGAMWLALPGLLLVLASLLPYLNKAYTNDDPLFLLSARQILKTPLHPMSYPVCWDSNEDCVQSAANLGPLAAQALMGYVLVPVIAFGGAEWIAHSIQILLACLAVLAMVRFALRLGCDRTQAVVAALLLAAIPPFLPMASSAMPDILAIALGLNGFERLLAWKDTRLLRDAAVAGLTLGLAPFARPHMALLLPLGALWLLKDFHLRKAAEQVRRDAYLWTPILLAGCVLAAVNLLTRDAGKSREVYDPMIGFAPAFRNLLSYLQYLAYPIPFAAVWLTMYWRKSPILLIGPAIPIVLHHFMLNPTGSLLQEWPWAASVYGLVALVQMFFRYWRKPDWSNRLLSLWVLFPLAAVIYTHMPMKYMVGVMPAIILILIRTLSELPGRREIATYSVLVLACAGFSFVLLRADADFANSGRRAAAELIAPHVAAGEKVWYGGIMGFYWYAHEAGAQVSKPGQPGPNPGELLAIAGIELGGATLKRFPNRELIDSRHYKSPHGRTMGYGGAFYSNSCGDAPWMWNPETTNDYELWRIR